jgi:mannose-6-phosphate isomerase-like protein (cupin superfamily)
MRITLLPAGPEVPAPLVEPTCHARVRYVSRHVNKPWGHETIWAETDRYVGKILFVRKGKRLSLQLHRRKDESIYVMRGRLRLTLEGEDGALDEVDLAPGESRRILPGRRHRFEALEDCELVEVSTPELDDVVRLEDDYGRGE